MAAWSMPSARPLVTVQPRPPAPRPRARAVPAPSASRVAAADDGELRPQSQRGVADAVEHERRIRQVQQARRVARIGQGDDRTVGAGSVARPEPPRRGRRAPGPAPPAPEPGDGEPSASASPARLRSERRPQFAVARTAAVDRGPAPIPGVSEVAARRQGRRRRRTAGKRPSLRRVVRGRVGTGGHAGSSAGSAEPRGRARPYQGFTTLSPTEIDWQASTIRP